jgi:hypothetical protein
MRKLSVVLIALIGILLLNGCESKKESATPAAETKPKVEAPEYESGRLAFQKLYVSARAFAADVQPYRLQSIYTAGAPAEQGKAGIWSAQFASVSRRSIKSYTWSGVSGENMPERGVSHGTEDVYNPSNSSTHVFDMQFLKIDSDKAFAEAQKHGGEALLKKDPKQPVFFLLEWSGKNRLVWHVIYGESRNDAKLAIAVDASSGAFIEKEH